MTPEEQACYDALRSRLAALEYAQMNWTNHKCDAQARLAEAEALLRQALDSFYLADNHRKRIDAFLAADSAREGSPQ